VIKGEGLLKTLNTVWTRIAAGLVLAQVLAALFMRPGHRLTTLGDAIPCLLVLTVMLAFGSNWRKSTGIVRLFWGLNEVGFGILLASEMVWFFYEAVLRKPAPTPVAGDGLFLLALIPTLGALALKPQTESEPGNLQLRSLDFFLLTFWWICLYMYFALPWQLVIQSYPNYNPAYYVLALAEHCTAIVALGVFSLKSQGEWKRLYKVFFVAMSLFAVGSLLQNIAIDKGLYKTGGWYDTPWIISLGMFTVVAALGTDLRSEDARAEGVPRNQGSMSARLALIGVITLPMLATAAFVDHQNPQAIVIFRLRIIFSALIFLGALTFLKLATMDRELLRLIDSKESSLEALKQVQNQILESQRMAALGRLAHGATHEISNPLTAILGYAQLLRDNPKLTREELKSVEDIHEQVHRAQAAINGIRKFLRAENGAVGKSSAEVKTP
jgi:signal transduction histidine kinase